MTDWTLAQHLLDSGKVSEDDLRGSTAENPQGDTDPAVLEGLRDATAPPPPVSDKVSIADVLAGITAPDKIAKLPDDAQPKRSGLKPLNEIDGYERTYEAGRRESLNQWMGGEYTGPVDDNGNPVPVGEKVEVPTLFADTENLTLADYGFGQLTEEDIAEVENYAAKYNRIRWDWRTDAPILGSAFQAADFFSTMQSYARMQEGVATRDDEKRVAKFFAAGFAPKSDAEGIFQFSKSMATSAPEYMIGFGLTKLAKGGTVVAMGKWRGEILSEIIAGSRKKAEERYLARQAQVLAGQRPKLTGRDVATGIGWGAVTAANVATLRQYGPAMFGMELGAWDLVQARRLFPEWSDMTDEEAQTIVALGEQGILMLLDAKDTKFGPLNQGFVEEFIKAGAEQLGGPLTRVPGLAHIAALEAMVMRKIAGKLPKGEGIERLATVMADSAAFDGATGETLEEIIGNIVAEGVVGDSFVEGLPSDMREVVHMYLGAALVGAGGASLKRAGGAFVAHLGKSKSQRDRETADQVQAALRAMRPTPEWNSQILGQDVVLRDGDRRAVVEAYEEGEGIERRAQVILEDGTREWVPLAQVQLPSEEDLESWGLGGEAEGAPSILDVMAGEQGAPAEPNMAGDAGAAAGEETGGEAVPPVAGGDASTPGEAAAATAPVDPGVSSEEFAQFTADGQVTPERVSSIARRVAAGQQLTPEELAMSQAAAPAIEAELQAMRAAPDPASDFGDFDGPISTGQEVAIDGPAGRQVGVVTGTSNVDGVPTATVRFGEGAAVQDVPLERILTRPPVEEEAAPARQFRGAPGAAQAQPEAQAEGQPKALEPRNPGAVGDQEFAEFQRTREVTPQRAAYMARKLAAGESLSLRELTMYDAAAPQMEPMLDDIRRRSSAELVARLERAAEGTEVLEELTIPMDGLTVRFRRGEGGLEWEAYAPDGSSVGLGTVQLDGKPRVEVVETAPALEGYDLAPRILAHVAKPRAPRPTRTSYPMPRVTEAALNNAIDKLGLLDGEVLVEPRTERQAESMQMGLLVGRPIVLLSGQGGNGRTGLIDADGTMFVHAETISPLGVAMHELGHSIKDTVSPEAFLGALQRLDSIRPGIVARYRDAWLRQEAGEEPEMTEPVRFAGKADGTARWDNGPRQPGVISSSLPTAKKRSKDPLQRHLVVSMSGLVGEAGKRHVANIAQFVRSLPFVRQKDTSDARAIAALRALALKNLLALHDMMPDAARQQARLWYDGAFRLAQDWGNSYGHTENQVAAVIAALSPQKDWYMNVAMAERTIETLRGQMDSVFSPEMVKWGRTLIKDQKTKKLHPRLPEQWIERLQGKTLRELIAEDRGAAARFVRAWSETNTAPEYNMWHPDGRRLGLALTNKGKVAKLAWGGYGSIAKAINVLLDGSDESLSAELGNAHKVRSFYNNIRWPRGDWGDVTIDTHAVAAALLMPLSGKSPEVQANLDGSGVGSSAIIGATGLYPLLADVYRQAAAQRGLLPREMQSITWEAVRGLFTPAFKQKSANVKDVRAIWSRYEKGNLSYEQAREAVIERAGGVNLPDWFVPHDAVPGEAGSREGVAVRVPSRGPLRGDDARAAAPGGLRDAGPEGAGSAAGDAGGLRDAAGGTRVERFAGARKQPQTETAAFKRWFGASKVVEPDGSPMITYRGNDYEGERRDQSGFIQVAFSPVKAEDYARGRAWEDAIETPDIGSFEFRQQEEDFEDDLGDDRRPHILPLYVRAENPWDFRNQAHREALAAATGLEPKAFEEGDAWTIEQNADAIRDAGFDSFYVWDNQDPSSSRSEDDVTLGVFSPSQLKSAIGNRGTFDGSNPDIRYAGEGRGQDVNLASDEAFANIAEDLAALIAFAMTPEGRADMVTIATYEPGLFSKMLNGIRRMFGRFATDSVLGALERIQAATSTRPDKAGAELAVFLADFYRDTFGLDATPAAEGAASNETLLERLRREAGRIGAPQVGAPGQKPPGSQASVVSRPAQPIPRVIVEDPDQPAAPVVGPNDDAGAASAALAPAGPGMAPAGPSATGRATGGPGAPPAPQTRQGVAVGAPFGGGWEGAVPRPDLNNPLQSPDTRQVVDEVDRLRNEQGLPAVRTRREANQLAKDELRRDYDGTRARIEDKFERGELIEEWETHAAAMILERLALDALAGREGALADALTFGNAYREQRSELARRLSTVAMLGQSARERVFDMITMATPSQRRRRARLMREINGIRRLVTPFRSPFAQQMQTRFQQEYQRGERTRFAKRKHKKGFRFAPGLVDEFGKTVSQERLDALNERLEKLDDMEEAGMQRAAAAVLRLGFDLDTLTPQDLTDPNYGWKITKAITSARATLGDKLLEWRYMSMLSGPTTHVRNISGNAVMLPLDGLVLRAAEATANLIVRDPESATFGELSAWLRGFGAAIVPAFKNMVNSYRTEGPAFEVDLQRRGVNMGVYGLEFGTRLEYLPGPKIQGFGARWLRHASLNTLLAMDEFFKTIAATSEAWSLAYRQASREKLTGKQREQRAMDLLGDMESDIWTQSLYKARAVTFQDEGGAGSKATLGVLNSLIAALDDLGDATVRIPIGSLIIPFRRTPVRIAARSVRLTPLQSTMIPFRAMHGEYKGKKHLLVRDLADALLAYGLSMTVLHMLDDEDDDGLPFITGPRDANYAMATLDWQTAPPMSIRAFGTYWSYAALEPFSTSMGLLVAAGEQFKREGTDEALQALLSAAAEQTEDKTFLRTIGDVLSLFDKRNQKEDKLLGFLRDTIVTPMVPNLLRAPLRESDDVLRQRREVKDGAAAFWLDGIVPTSGDPLAVMTGAAPRAERYDAWGQVITKPHARRGGSDTILRLLNPVRPMHEIAKTAPLDMALRKFNDKVERGELPDERVWYPVAPPDEITIDGVKYNMTDEEYRMVTRDAGRIAAEALLADPGLNLEDPGPDDIREIKRTLTNARNEQRDKISEERRALSYSSR